MVSEKIQTALNKHVTVEADASQIYLAMATWSELKGFKGFANFMYKHSDEERMHMLKMIKFINDRGGHAIISALPKPPASFGSFKQMFQTLYDHEVMVSEKINELVELSLKEKDYPTYNFLQWYVEEQIEEETLARDLLDKIKLIGEDKGGLYLFDRDLAAREY